MLSVIQNRSSNYMHLIEKNENCAFNGHFLKTKQNIDDKH